MYQGPYEMWGSGSTSGLAMFVFMLLFWVAIGGVILYFVRHSSHSHGAPHVHQPQGLFATPVDSPVDTLKMRFAKGELNEEEFTARRRILEGQ